MKVLLINNNPVVGKLVTLSAQKTGDELSSVHSVDEVTAGEYDFILIDDAGYSDDLLDELRTKAEFSKSCFIGSRSTEKPSGFTHEINKPFLPTDLVDIFIKVSSDTKGEKSEDEAAQTNEDVLSDEGLDISAGLTDDLGGLDDALPNAADEVIDLEDLDALDSLDEVFEHNPESDESVLDYLNEKSEETVAETVVTDETEHQSVLDDEDVKEVQDLLVETEEGFPDELNEALLEDDAQTEGSAFADEATLDEINSALEGIDEDEDVVSLDDALDAFKEEENSVETLGDVDLSDLEEEFGSAEVNIADLSADDDMNGFADDQLDSDEDLDGLLDELDLEEESSAEEETSEELVAEDADLLDEMLSDDDLLEGLDLLEEDVAEDETLSEEVANEEAVSAAEEAADEESLTELLDEEGDLSDTTDLLEDAVSAEEEASAADEANLEELLVEEDIIDEAADSDVSEDLDELLLDDTDLLEETADEESLMELLDEEDDLSDVTDLLEATASEEDEGAIAEEMNLEELTQDEEALDELSIEEPDLSDEMLSEVSEDEEAPAATEEGSEDTNEIDLSALNDEIEEALSELDEDDLMSEIDEGDISSLDDELDSLSASDIKIALGEANDEDSDIQDEIEELESSIETEEELGLSVGQSEFASLNKEALSEARGEGLPDDNDHPELEEVNAFVDEVAVEGASNFDMSSKASADESIATLENLINTLKQGNVKEALKGMEMNIKISFSEKSE